MIVLDASVAAKWYLKEAGSEQALELLAAHSGSIHGPDLLAIEVVATLVRETNSKVQPPALAQRYLETFAALCRGGGIKILRQGISDVLIAADIAINIGHPLKDCLYLALAMELGCPLVTADARFAAKTRAVYGEVRVLGE
jgi:predicted nucleic acid-binding protein